MKLSEFTHYKGMTFKRFTLDQILFVEQNYPTMRNMDISEATGLTTGDLYYLQQRLKVSKGRDMVRLEAKLGQINRDDNSGRFRSGLVPWNKGKKMSDELRRKVQHTFYTKGHLPHNTRKDFDIGTRRDKTGVIYKFIRLSKAHWVALHRYVWQLHYGEIPKGRIIVFRDGNQENCTIENLMMIDRKKNMKRNTFMNLPDDVRDLLQAKRVLTRMINQQKDE